jgi:XTP/dITP diphosphohydrolase
MNTIVFATNNIHKLNEIKDIINGKISIVSLSEIDCNDDIPETARTLEGNALLKARYVKEKYGYDCFADDTGLEVEALNGEPGVFSARYAGAANDSNANIAKLLSNLRGEGNRNARFRTVFALIIDEREFLFDGVIRGKIIDEQRGNNGFGYDPVFIPEGYSKTFAELGAWTKNKISHRAIAAGKLASLLNAGNP